jgi:uncharacterized membrane protein YdjX (TVP38/TMEM64 family)
MRRYLLLALGLMVLLLACFGIVQALDIPLLVSPDRHLRSGGPGAAALAVALLVGDVLLPVPSSIVMTWLGALYGVAAGAALAFAGSLGAAAVAFALGRRGGPLLERLVPAADRARIDRLLSRYAGLALVATRPIPILAETTALLAGASPAVTWPRMLLASAIGCLPAAILYAAAGALAADTGSATLVFAAALTSGALFFLVGRALTRRSPDVLPRPPASDR